MDIYSFVGSRDIREHLRTINYQPNAIEAAYLIYMSYNATLEEKMTVWEELMMTVPDRAMTQRLNLPATDSFYGFLRQYMEAQKRRSRVSPMGKAVFIPFGSTITAAERERRKVPAGRRKARPIQASKSAGNQQKNA